jgi:glycosyltransferase involved in cell wall biosynthesis
MKFIKDFTVLMPIHQREDIFLLFDKSIKSVYENTLKPKKVIILIDGKISLDLKTKIFFYKRKFGFQVIQSKNNIGLTKILNIGINKTCTKWIIRADADDYNLPQRFAKLMILKNQKFDLIGSQVYEVDFNSGDILKRQVPLNDNKIKFFLKFRNPFNHMSVAFKTEFVKKCGGYPDLYMKEDYALWATMISKGAVVKNIKDFLIKANTGYQMYKRRTGIKHVISEIKLQQHMIKNNINGILSSIFIGLFRIIFCLTPYTFKKLFYKFFLREKKL